MKIKTWLRILLMLVAAVGLTYFLELRYFLNDPGRTAEFVANRPLVFCYNAVLMLLIVIFITGVVRKPFLSIGVTWSLVAIITYIHISKFTLRGNPLLPEDFQLATEAASLTKFVDIWGIVRLVLAVILMIVAMVLLDKRTAKWLQNAPAEGSWAKRHQVALRLAMILVATVGFVWGTDFARNHQGQRYEDITWLDSQFVAWNQVRNYDDNGFLLGFMYNWGKFKLAEPEGYTAEAVAESAATYEEKQSSDTAKELADQDYNIVIILNESFYDPAQLKGIYNYEGGEVLPTIRKLATKYPSGKMYSLDYGGGTANIEFEAFTGLSNYWANTVPYTDLIPKVSRVPSIASFAKHAGYETLAIHPFNGGMYKRNIALSKEGFDEFITELEMDFDEHEGPSEYINDWSAYQQVLKELRERDNKQLIGLITMENHAPYNAENYSQHDFTVTNVSDQGLKSDIETYLQTLHSSDAYLGEFISELDKFEEKTVVLFFGDHSAGIFPEAIENSSKSVRDLAHLTPYFIYANFDLKTKDLTLPTTTPNCLTNTLYDVLGIKKPSTHYLLEEVCQETPILTPGYFDGEEPTETAALRQYQLLNYDILGGKQYWLRDEL